ncbi:MAG: hypothetical protein QM579_02670, partial [Desulfovibrio sp.]|uniref:hypothetical protein n=1 Tax=Desulfovibrio sp. TaxID=885 RepID=UPI0039E4219E
SSAWGCAFYCSALILWFGVGLAIMAWTFWGLARFFLRRGLGDYSTAFLRIVLIRWLGRLVLMGGILYISLIIYQAPVFALVGGMLAGGMCALVSFAFAARAIRRSAQ